MLSRAVRKEVTLDVAEVALQLTALHITFVLKSISAQAYIFGKTFTPHSGNGINKPDVTAVGWRPQVGLVAG